MGKPLTSGRSSLARERRAYLRLFPEILEDSLDLRLGEAFAGHFLAQLRLPFAELGAQELLQLREYRNSVKVAEFGIGPCVCRLRV